MKIHLPLLVLIIIISACENKKDTDCLTYYKVPVLSENAVEKMAVKLLLNRIMLDSTIESSFVGDFWINKDTLHFSDLYYNFVYRFNKTGSVIDRHLGRGKGPNEVLDFMHSLPFQDGYCFVSISNSFVYLFDNNWIKEKQFRIHWDVKSKYKEILNHPDPQKIEPYELRMGLPGMVKQWDHNHLVLAISASHPKFNGYFNSSLYYNHSRILALVNTETEKIDELIGRRSPFYLEHTNIPNLDHCIFDLAYRELFVTFWPEPFIYVIDKQSKNAIGKFGKPGRNMRINYPLTQNFEDAEMNRRKDWIEFGHYSYLLNEPKNGLLFRGYTKGGGAISDGLQIYKNYQLIGDFDVPLGFKIIGAIGNELFASCDTEKESSSLYLFKMHLEYEK